MDIGLSFTKYTLFFFNLLFAAIGIAMVVIGVDAIIKISEYHDLTENIWVGYPVLLIIVGCAVFFIASLGCCGAIKENTCMLCSYSLIMIILVGIEIVLAYRGYVTRAQIEINTKTQLNYTLHHADKVQSYKATWDLLQNRLKCCGVDGPNDWNHVLPGDVLPASCCEKVSDNQTCNKTEAIQTGCQSALVNFLNSHITSVIVIAIGAVVIQLLAIIFPCCLFSAFRRDERLPRRWNRRYN